MSAIEKAILDATGAKPQKDGESRQKFLLRLMAGVQKLTDDQWEGLAATEGAQDWYNAATEADNDKDSVPDFPDVEDVGEDPEDELEEDPEENDEEDEGEEESEPEEEEVMTKTKPAAGKKAAKVKAAPAKKAAAKTPDKKEANGADRPAPKKQAESRKVAAGGKKPTSMRRTLKMIVIKKPKMPVDELIEALEKKGFKSPSKLTVTSIRADTRDTIKVLNEASITQIDL